MSKKDFINLAGLIIELRKNDDDLNGASHYVEGYIVSLLEREKSFDKIRFQEYIKKNTI